MDTDHPITDKPIKHSMARFFVSYVFFCLLAFIISGMVADFGETIISVIIAITFTTIGIFVGFLVKSGKHSPVFIAFSISWIILFLSGIIYSFVAHVFKLSL